MLIYKIIGITIVVFFIFLFSTFYTVEENNWVIIERFGKFSSFSEPGLHFKIPFIDEISGSLTKSIRSLNVSVETKTKDNVFVYLSVSSQCKYDSTKIFEATYLMPEESLLAYIEDKIRAIVPNYTLDELFEQKNEVADEVKQELSTLFKEYGTIILNTLITELLPAGNVKDAMNEINAAQRFKIAAIEKAEAEKIAVVKAAEAQAESKILQGKGIAGQRKAIIEGLRDSLEELKKNPDHSKQTINEQEAITILLLNQYFDTLRDIGANSKTNSIFLNNNPSGLGSLIGELKSTITEANLISNEIKLANKTK